MAYQHCLMVYQPCLMVYQPHFNALFNAKTILAKEQ